MASEKIVTTKNVCRTYQMGSSTIRALDDISIDISRGEFVALVGASGSGKSTLLNLIGGLDTPSSGQIVVCGRDLATLTERERATHRKFSVGMIFQSFNLIPSMTAAENVALALAFGGVTGSARKKRTHETFEQLNMADRLSHKPGELSGGEQQRTAIARALVNEPELLLADEPTGNLDGKTSLEIMELLSKINENGKTILMVTHNEKLASHYAHRTVRLSYGKLVDENRGDDAV